MEVTQNVELHSSDLLAVAKEIEENSNVIEEALRELDTTMAGLDSVWSDQNSKKYLERYEELKQNFPEYKAAVKSYGTFLENVVSEYQKEFVDPTSESVNSSR